MATYTITSQAGTGFGDYEGETPADALAAMHADAGYTGITAENGTIVWPDAKTRETCGDVEDWLIEEADMTNTTDWIPSGYESWMTAEQVESGAKALAHQFLELGTREEGIDVLRNGLFSSDPLRARAAEILEAGLV